VGAVVGETANLYCFQNKIQSELHVSPFSTLHGEVKNQELPPEMGGFAQD
jgi:hypothetical protein